MPVKKYNPITPGTRYRVGNAFTEVTTDTPEKSLMSEIKRTGGRNHDGKMTVRQRGGGHKRKYRIIDFKRNKDGIPAKVASIEYDPNRSAFIALLNYADGEKRYMIAAKGLQVGATVQSGTGSPIEPGNTLVLKDIPLGSEIYAIEMQPNKGAAIARSAGTYAVLVGKEEKYAAIKLPSGEVRRILMTCKATIGIASNPDHSLLVLGKAGRSVWLGRRPRVRGVAMNPVDHPMGGGEGKASGGHPISRTGIMAKGQKTRNVNKKSSALIISRRKSK
ncbi:MAG: 50S ribosomal protein L2 [Saprospiraceae bacterium]|nr:50S ribosomal protein L2 [Candidatus Brachybacter algidus]